MLTCMGWNVSVVWKFPSNSTVCRSFSSSAGASVAQLGSIEELPTLTVKLSGDGSTASGYENVTGRASFMPSHSGRSAPSTAS